MNNNKKKFTFAGRIQSFKYAIDGTKELLKSEHNARVHLVATISVVLIGFFVQITAVEWCFLVLAIVLVWVCEALNTALELLCDVVSSEFHPMIKKSKDIAAAAVLISAVGASVIGLIIFLPHL